MALALAWCAADVLREMQRDGSGHETLLDNRDDAGALSEKKGGEDAAVKDADEPAFSCPADTGSVPALPSARTAKTASPPRLRVSEEQEVCVVASHATAVVPLSVLFTRRKFAALFTQRMRSAVGLDHKYREALLMIVPAVVYALQGLLLIYALKLLDPTVFQVLFQVRIIFLALMMRAVLDLRLSAVRWAALVALVLGITLAQLGSQGGRAETTTAAPNDAKATTVSATTWSAWGTIAVVCGAVLNAFSGVFMEYVLKKRGSHFHLSARNIHLAFFSVLYFLLIFAYEVLTSSEAVGLAESTANFMNGFFEGFTGLVWFLVVLQAIGGMLVAVVVRYCDNIVKSFSSAFAIVLSGTASVLLFNTPMSATFVAGSLLVMGSITLYGLKG